MTKNQLFYKRIFDLFFALVLLILFLFPILLLTILSSIDTKKFGIFSQQRIGQYGKAFTIYKIRTMIGNPSSTVTVKDSMNITPIGKWLRKYKLDELPQLFNILLGEMSFVGPRPDVEGFADRLKGEDSIILTIKPGVTGPASLYFRNEELLLSKQENPEKYNQDVIWKKKIELNKAYIDNYSFKKDLFYIIKTIF